MQKWLPATLHDPVDNLDGYRHFKMFLTSTSHRCMQGISGFTMMGYITLLIIHTDISQLCDLLTFESFYDEM